MLLTSYMCSWIKGSCSCCVIIRQFTCFCIVEMWFVILSQVLNLVELRKKYQTVNQLTRMTRAVTTRIHPNTKTSLTKIDTNITNTSPSINATLHKVTVYIWNTKGTLKFLWTTHQPFTLILCYSINRVRTLMTYRSKFHDFLYDLLKYSLT